MYAFLGSRDKFAERSEKRNEKVNSHCQYSIDTFAVLIE